MRSNCRTIILVALIIAAGAAAQAQRGGRKVSGTVLSAETGRPLAGVPVQYEEGATAQATTTDDKGYFEFEQPGTLGIVIVAHPQYATTYRRWPAETGQLQILLVAPAVVTGTVRDAATRAAVPADVTVLVEEAGSFVSLSSEAQGPTYTIRDVPSGPAILIASAKGYAPAWSTLAVSVGDTHTVDMALLLEAAVRGTVVDGNGDPLRGAEVFVTYSDEAGAFGMLESFTRGAVISNDAGEFYLFGLIPDVPIELQAILGDDLSDVATVTVEPGMAQPGVVLTIQ